jgi:hypothetical protein
MISLSNVLNNDFLFNFFKEAVYSKVMPNRDYYVIHYKYCRRRSTVCISIRIAYSYCGVYLILYEYGTTYDV